MAEALQTYIVTPKAGEFVAGILSAGAGTTIRLTEAQARYKLLIGSIVLDGTPVLMEPPVGPISANDRLDLTRGSKAWDASVGELLAFLLTRILPEVTETLGDVEGRILGGAGLADNTLGKLASRIALLASSSQAKLDAKAARSHTSVFDVDYECVPDDVQIGMEALTAHRTISLTDVDKFPHGQDLVIADFSGACSDTRTITVQPGAGTSDVIVGPEGATTIVLFTPYQAVRFRRGSANLWIRQ